VGFGQQSDLPSTKEGMEICYLNLARRADRDAAFLQFNSHLSNLRRIDAVDGNSLDLERLVREGIMAGPLPGFTQGALGNALSHRMIWEQSIQCGAAVTIAEDDAVFNLHFEPKASRVLSLLPPDWDLIYWGWNFDSGIDVQILEGLRHSVMFFEKGNLGTDIGKFRNLDSEVIPLRLFGAFGTVAYSASAKGAEALLRNCFPLRHENIFAAALQKHVSSCSMDVTMSKYFPVLKAYICIPPLAWTENDKAASDVRPEPG
jgi:glycosyl transferase family 25